MISSALSGSARPAATLVRALVAHSAPAAAMIPAVRPASRTPRRKATTAMPSHDAAVSAVKANATWVRLPRRDVEMPVFAGDWGAARSVGALISLRLGA